MIWSRDSLAPMGSGDYAPRRVPLPLCSGVNILPGVTATITSRSQLDQFWFRRLLIKHAERWVVHDVRSTEHSLFSRETCQEISGDRFAARATESPLRIDEPLSVGDDFSVQVTYVGPDESGEPFECCAFGGERPSELDPDPAGSMISEVVSVGASSEVAILPMVTASHVLLITDAMLGAFYRGRGEEDVGFWPERLAIEDAVDWIVHDVVVGGESLMLNSGNLPGAMFSDGPGSQPINMGRLSSGGEFAIVVTYVGLREGGSTLRYRLSGPRYSRGRSTSVPQALLEISSIVNLLPFTSAHIIARVRTPGGNEFAKYAGPAGGHPLGMIPRLRSIPEGFGLRLVRVVIDHADDWVVNDFKIGVASQFAQSGDVPGAAFSSDAAPGLISFDPARSKIDVAITVTYVGLSVSGAHFVCGAVGDVVSTRERGWLGDSATGHSSI